MTIENNDVTNTNNSDDVLTWYTIGVAPITDTISASLLNNKYAIPVKIVVEGPEYT
ncbi:MAG: hypothetical protein HON23_02125 [Rickettsiales bacterium]|jgi:hypothetical protein|nr:hypothetical protein [Rickettsiales bacterium]